MNNITVTDIKFKGELDRHEPEELKSISLLNIFVNMLIGWVYLKILHLQGQLEIAQCKPHGIKTIEIKKEGWKAEGREEGKEEVKGKRKQCVLKFQNTYMQLI